MILHGMTYKTYLKLRIQYCLNGKIERIFMKKLVIATLLVMGTIAVAATSVNALDLEQEQRQSGEQKVEWKCNPTETTTTSSYGTTTVRNGNCEGSVNQKFEQEQRQSILGEQVVVKDEGVRRIHYPVDTAMDTRTMIAALSITAVGGIAFAVRKKVA
jgi:hypothetical protein